ncbi:MAG: NUDIX domain-containing protein [Bacteroidota bacterium]
MSPSKFNIRVYGILIQNQALLVSDEFRMGMRMTKLPGGGLEFGEGIEEGLKREWMEELRALIQVGPILYVNPFFQRSAFSKIEQVICLYYKVSCMSPLEVEIVEQPFDFMEEKEGAQVFRWIPLGSLTSDVFTFPIDKAMVTALKLHIA